MKATFFLLPVILLACGGSSPPSGPDAEPGADAAPPECADGEMRVGPCGNCGTGQQLCEGGSWVLQGACFDEGVCPAGTLQTAAAPLCGEQQRLCNAQCAWTDWTVTMPGDGECEPGHRRLDQQDCGAGMYRRQVCSDTCAWETQPGQCVDACGESPRVTANEDEEEVCVPAGDFIRGLAGEMDAEPVTTVTLSAFYIDKYVVTNRRYKACYDAGGCPAPVPNALSDLVDPMMSDYPTWAVSEDLADAFCAWDGGRRRLTEAEWEKAARGPAPRTNKFTWDGDTWRCDLVLTGGCVGFVPWDPPPTETYLEPYDANPGEISYYGVHGLLGAGTEWTHDYFDPDYYALPESLIDPQGPATGPLVTLRGCPRRSCGTGETVSNRSPGDPGMGGASDIIRCGRTAVGP